MRHVTIAAVFAVTLFWTARGAAGNDLTNPDFDSDVSGWSATVESSAKSGPVKLITKLAPSSRRNIRSTSSSARRIKTDGVAFTMK